MTDRQKQTIKAIVNIFETGKIAGNYASVAVLPGDSGHLSYGRSQATLGGGALFALLGEYCGRSDAQLAGALKPYLARVKGKDFTLDRDAAFRGILTRAGADPAMHAAQDEFFDRAYFDPACASAAAMSIVSPLGQAVVYDSCVQGGWNRLRAQLPPVASVGGEAEWVRRYVALRRNWLLSRPAPLPGTVYRMDTFIRLMADNNQELELPIEVHGTTIAA